MGGLLLGVNYMFKYAYNLSYRYYHDLLPSQEKNLLFSGFLDCLIYSGFLFEHDKSRVFNSIVYNDQAARMGLPD